MWNRILLGRLLWLGLIVAASCATAWACNVPVFRYALEHWRPDDYRAVILHNGTLSEQSQKSMAVLMDAIDAKRLNMTVKQIDLRTANREELPDGLAALSDSGQSHLLVHYPSDLNIASPLVSGALDSVDVQQLIDSPLRRELLRRLAAGQSAVWLFVASGNEPLDTAARTTLDSELRALQSTLELPKLTDDPEDAIKGGPPLKLEFSLLELAKDDMQEWALRTMLLGSEPDLKELQEPMVFPVFGCGRALWPLVGAGISADNLRESATFLAGACSCQVKEQNPGFDLLLHVAWDELLPWTTGQDSSHTLGQQVQVAETIPIPSGSNMSEQLLAKAGATATGAAAPPVPTQAADTGSMTMIMVALAGGSVCTAGLSHATFWPRCRVRQLQVMRST